MENLDIKYIFLIISFILIIPWKYLYIKSIIQWRTKPHIYTYIILWIILTIGWLVQLNNWWWYGSSILIIWWLWEFLIVYLALKYWQSKIVKSDKYILFLALLCIPMYLYSTNEYIVLFFVIFIDILAMIPTIRKSIYFPESENLSSWNISTFKHFFSILAMSNFSLLTILYPLIIVMTNIVLISVIIYFRKQKE